MGKCSCCDKIDKEDEKPTPKPLNERGCTDCLCCIFFLLFFAGMVGIFIVTLGTGDPLALLYDADYLGNRCGTGDFSNRTKALYPRIADDLLEQRAYLLAGSVWKIKLYALWCVPPTPRPAPPRSTLDTRTTATSLAPPSTLRQSLRLAQTICCPPWQPSPATPLRESHPRLPCSPRSVEECPEAFDIQSPTVFTDYGYDPASEVTQALGDKTQASWISPLPTYDVLNRCIPYSEADNVEADFCAFPNCNATEAMAVGAVCDPDGAGEWEMSNLEQETVCVVKMARVSGRVYSMQMAEETSDASEALMEYIAQAAGFLNDIVSSLSQTAVFLAGFGILLPIVLAFAYALFLRFFAAAALYTMMIILVLSMLLATVVCYVKAGMALGGVTAESVMDALQNSTGVSVDAALVITDPTLATLVSVETGDKTVYEVGFWVMAVLSVVTFVAILLSLPKLRMCIAIVREACSVFRTMPSLMLFPFTTVLFEVLVCVWCLIGAFLICTSKAESFEDAIASLNSTLEGTSMSTLSDYASGDAIATASDLSASTMSALSGTDGQDLIYITAAYWIFGFLWTIQFINAVAWTTMSGAVVYWYFYRKKKEHQTKLPILEALGRVLKYHLGSMAFGALIIAICQFVRLLMEWLDHQTKQMQETNVLLKVVMKCTKCCLWCFEKTIRFVTGYGFVYVALEGCGFCPACWKTFKFIASNLQQVVVNTVVSKLLTLLAMVAIPVACSAGAFAYFEQVLEVRNPMYPTFFVLVASAIVSNACTSVFECTITTIFVCCFRDKDYFNGDHMSDELAKAFGLPPTGKGGKGEKEELTKDDGKGDFKEGEDDELES